jgi:hypothetical protein
MMVAILESDASLLQQRYNERGSEQSDQFISGRKTKYENIKKDGRFPVYTAQHNNALDTKKLVLAMTEFVLAGKVNTDVFHKHEIDSLAAFF